MREILDRIEEAKSNFVIPTGKCEYCGADLGGKLSDAEYMKGKDGKTKWFCNMDHMKKFSSDKSAKVNKSKDRASELAKQKPYYGMKRKMGSGSSLAAASMSGKFDTK